MKSILVMFVVVVSFVFVANGLWALELNRDAGTRINRSSDSTPVIRAFYDGTGTGAAIDGTADVIGGVNTTGVYGRSVSARGHGVFGVVGEYVAEDLTLGEGSGVVGISKNTIGSGVYGGGLGASGIGVYGWSPFYLGIYGGSLRDTGVHGYSRDGYGIYSQGNAKVQGNLEVTGVLNVSSLNITGAIPTYTNLAQTAGATITADSEHGPRYPASNARDGIISRWDEGEWASLNKGAVYYRDLRDPSGRAWLQLDWPAPGQNINTIKIYDRPNRFDKILDAWLLVRRGDGTTTDLHLGMFPYGGAPKVINLTSAEGTGVTSIKLTITEVGPDTLNVGVSEIECFRDRSIW